MCDWSSASSSGYRGSCHGGSNHSAIDRYDLAGDIGGTVRDEECSELGYLFRRAGAFHRNEPVDELLVENLIAHRRCDDSGCDSVDRNSAAGKLERQGFGGSVQAALGGSVIDLPAIAGDARHRGEIHYPAPACADHRHEKRLGHVEEAVERDVDHF